MSRGILVRTGEDLDRFVRNVAQWEQRDIFSEYIKFLESPLEETYTTVAILYGLRRTGKTTMMQQAAALLGGERSAFIEIFSPKADIGEIDDTVSELQERGVRYFFFDEVTKMDDFMSCAGIFANKFAVRFKITLTGADSLAFWLSEKDELYNRAVFYLTTKMSFLEWRRLMKKENNKFDCDDIDTYLRYGGIFENQDIHSDNAHLPCHAKDSSTFTEDSIDAYINTSVARNIQNSLERYRGGSRFHSLAVLYDEDKLLQAITNVVRDEGCNFVAKKLSVEHKETNIAKILGIPNARSVLREDLENEIYRCLEIKSHSSIVPKITENETIEIKEYLERLNFIEYGKTWILNETSKVAIPETIITQPAIRYWQINSVYAAMQKKYTTETASQSLHAIWSTLIGGLLEESIYVDIAYALDCAENIEVCTIRWKRNDGEFYIALCDKHKKEISLIEIRHSKHINPNFLRNFANEDFLAAIEREFGRIVEKIILYLGPTLKENEDRVKYINVSEFLESITKIIVKNTSIKTR